MEWTKKNRDGWTVLKITGVINSETSNDLKILFDQTLSEGTHRIRLNLKQVPISNSSGIGHILNLFKLLKERDGQLEIHGVSKNLFEMLRLLKVNELIPIQEDE
jgi:anti-sigma B factor antagonist/stage II sporulation protein AA (anti-sigma F factor antagonist)